MRGIYVNAHAAGSPTEFPGLLDLAESPELNTGRDFIGDLPALLQALRDQGVYTIARIVCFRDAILAQAKPEWAIRATTGAVWLNPESNLPWVDPYNPDVWAYNIDLAREALAAGFAEVQWDYVRFPDVSDSVRATMVFPAQQGRSAGDAIEEFIATYRLDLADFDAPITAAVFGRVIAETGASNIGQEWDRLVRVTDLLLPIIYPALYGPGSFGLPDPDPNAAPYQLVRAAMDSAVSRLEGTPGAAASIRPWLQAYSWGSSSYAAQEILDQVSAMEDAGLEEWLFWHPESEYPAGAF